MNKAKKFGTLLTLSFASLFCGVNSFATQNVISFSCSDTKKIFSDIDSLSIEEFSTTNSKFINLRQDLADFILSFSGVQKKEIADRFLYDFYSCFSNDPELQFRMILNDERKNVVENEIEGRMGSYNGKGWQPAIKVGETALKIATFPGVIAENNYSLKDISPFFKALGVVSIVGLPLVLEASEFTTASLVVGAVYRAGGYVALSAAAATIGWGIGDTIGWLSYQGAAKLFGFRDQLEHHRKQDALYAATQYMLNVKRTK